MPPDTEPAIKAGIARGHANVRESRVTPHPAIARLVTAAAVADEGAPAERAVVWAEAARDVLVARVHPTPRFIGHPLPLRKVATTALFPARLLVRANPGEVETSDLLVRDAAARLLTMRVEEAARVV